MSEQYRSCKHGISVLADDCEWCLAERNERASAHVQPPQSAECTVSKYRLELQKASHEQLCEWILQLESDVAQKFDMIMERGEQLNQLSALVERHRLFADFDPAYRDCERVMAQCDAAIEEAITILDIRNI